MGWGSHPLLTVLLSARVHSVWEAYKPQALFYELSASTEYPVGPGSTVSKQRSPPLSNVKGTGPAADCCVSGPLFFDYSFLCDSDDEELAGIVELCHSPPQCSRTPRRPRNPLLTFVGQTAPTRKARTQLWRTKVAKSNRKFWAGLKKGTGQPRPATEEPCTARLEEGSPPPSVNAQAPTQGTGTVRRRPRRHTNRRSSEPQHTAAPHPAGSIINELIPALRQHKSWGPCEHLSLALAEAVEEHEELSLPYRVAYEILEATQGDSWLDTELAVAFLEDVAAQLQNVAPAEDLLFVSANITTWSPEILRWHQPGQGPLLIQELHLGDEGVKKLRIDALSKGFHLFLPPVEGPRPTKGGVATLVPIDLQGRHRGGYLSEDGAGFVIVELPRVRYSLLLVNLYLRPGVGPTGGPNPQIIARLLPLLKQGANWIVAGDWNYPSQEMEETSLPENFRGKVVAPGVATISTGNCLDFAVASSRVAPLLQCSANWNVPFRPHAAVAFRLAISGGQVPLPQLSAFEGSLRPKEKDQRETGTAVPSGNTPSPSSTSGERKEPAPLLGCFGRTWLASTPANVRFARFTTSVAERHFTKPGGRGCARPIIHKPLMQPKAGLPWYGQEAAWWQKLQQAWEPPVAPSSRFQALRSCCPDPTSANLTQALASAGIVHPSPVDFLCSPPGNTGEFSKVRTVVKAGCSQAVAEARNRETQDYQRWLLGASVKGMKPLFRAVKKQEAVVVRPFLNEPAEARPFLRLRQWARLWDAQGTPPPPISGLKERAIQQAMALPALGGCEFEKLIRSMPSKAAGLDGWSVDLLKSLDAGEVASLASLWREIEVTGELPTQMTFTAFIMLAKTETIERPIGLMSTLLKLGMKARWGLIEQWLVEYRDHLWWDCALPSRSTHDASLRRGFAYEAAHADRVHRCSLFVDLSTFYEGVDHLGLCEAASRAGFPDMLLHLAVETYRGGRIIVSDEVASPTAYACKGIIAGCPLAPTLSKLAVGESIRQTCTGPDIDYVGTWIDDISVDTEHKQADRAAAAVVRVFRRLHKALTADGHQVSIGKTYFIASSPVAERALKKKLGAGDPPIQTVAKDLGMELTGGRRRCTHLSSARRSKAHARLGKLKGLRIKSPRTTSRIFSMSVLASGQWGHQAQGVSPKVMRSVRLQAASIAGRVNTGSIEVALEMGGPSVQDPLVSIVTQHFKALARVLVSLRDREQLSRTWAQLTEQLRRPDRWKVVCGPLGAMVAYLYDLGIKAPYVHQWLFPATLCPATLAGTVEAGHMVSLNPLERSQWAAVTSCLGKACDRKRWDALGRQFGCSSLSQGIDTTVPCRLLKHAPRSKTSALRTAWQGAMKSRKASAEQPCPLCRKPLTPQHMAMECKWWRGRAPPPPKHWERLRVKYPYDCLWARALCQPQPPGCRVIGMARPRRRPRASAPRTPGPLSSSTRLMRAVALMPPTREAESSPGPFVPSPGTTGLPSRLDR